MSNLVHFNEMDEDGTLQRVRSIPKASILACPHRIMWWTHYRENDNTCRCNDPSHIAMIEWGYVWDGERWVATEDSHQ